MSEKIARYFNEKAAKDGTWFPGVPTRDLTEDEFNALPEYMRRSIDASDLYTKTSGSKAKSSAKAESDTNE